ncbi:hypothetical protein BB558_003247 [Smittium angustum]|uniref:Uncharacterized protein n=1 Tax=Smittium angustum TaxID=133377 RepID=A0A2U1J6I2_SMIAN|nr:hypothetical protein BB558_003247 [Smittium angustum]
MQTNPAFEEYYKADVYYNDSDTEDAEYWLNIDNSTEVRNSELSEKKKILNYGKSKLEEIKLEFQKAKKRLYETKSKQLDNELKQVHDFTHSKIVQLVGELEAKYSKNLDQIHQSVRIMKAFEVNFYNSKAKSIETTYKANRSKLRLSFLSDFNKKLIQLEDGYRNSPDSDSDQESTTNSPNHLETDLDSNNPNYKEHPLNHPIRLYNHLINLQSLTKDQVLEDYVSIFDKNYTYINSAPPVQEIYHKKHFPKKKPSSHPGKSETSRSGSDQFDPSNTTRISSNQLGNTPTQIYQNSSESKIKSIHQSNQKDSTISKISLSSKFFNNNKQSLQTQSSEKNNNKNLPNNISPTAHKVHSNPIAGLDQGINRLQSPLLDSNRNISAAINSVKPFPQSQNHHKSTFSSLSKNTNEPDHPSNIPYSNRNPEFSQNSYNGSIPRSDSFDTSTYISKYPKNNHTNNNYSSNYSSYENAYVPESYTYMDKYTNSKNSSFSHNGHKNTNNFRNYNNTTEFNKNANKHYSDQFNTTSLGDTFKPKKQKLDTKYRENEAVFRTIPANNNRKDINHSNINSSYRPDQFTYKNITESSATIDSKNVFEEPTNVYKNPKDHKTTTNSSTPIFNNKFDSKNIPQSYSPQKYPKQWQEKTDNSIPTPFEQVSIPPILLNSQESTPKLSLPSIHSMNFPKPPESNKKTPLQIQKPSTYNTTGNKRSNFENESNTISGLHQSSTSLTPRDIQKSKTTPKMSSNNPRINSPKDNSSKFYKSHYQDEGKKTTTTNGSYNNQHFYTSSNISKNNLVTDYTNDSADFREKLVAGVKKSLTNQPTTNNSGLYLNGKANFEHNNVGQQQAPQPMHFDNEGYNSHYYKQTRQQDYNTGYPEEQWKSSNRDVSNTYHNNYDQTNGRKRSQYYDNNNTNSYENKYPQEHAQQNKYYNTQHTHTQQHSTQHFHNQQHSAQHVHGQQHNTHINRNQYQYQQHSHNGSGAVDNYYHAHQHYPYYEHQSRDNYYYDKSGTNGYDQSQSYRKASRHNY